MIHNYDRSGWFGASDTAIIMGRWDTETFRRWWLQKIGIRKEHFTTPAMQAGTAYEHRILSAIGVRTMDKQIRIRRYRLRVNYDGEFPDTIIEVKTYGKPVFKVSKAYWQQCQVEMFASGYGFWRHRKRCNIVAYRLTEAEMQNYFLAVDTRRLSSHEVQYDECWVRDAYLPRLRYLARCLRTGHWPSMEEFYATG